MKNTFLTKTDGENVLTSFYSQYQRILDWLLPEHEWTNPRGIRNRKLAQHYWTFVKKIKDIIESFRTQYRGMQTITQMMDALCDNSYMTIATFTSLPEAVHAFDTTTLARFDINRPFEILDAN